MDPQGRREAHRRFTSRLGYHGLFTEPDMRITIQYCVK